MHTHTQEDEHPLEFLQVVGMLKTQLRTGWVLRGVHRPESVADHMYRMAVLGFLAPAPYNTDKCIKMALVHDMAEALVGDITPHQGISKQEKYRMEHEAMQRIRSTLGDSRVAKEIYELWLEYEEQVSTLTSG